MNSSVNGNYYDEMELHVSRSREEPTAEMDKTLTNIAVEINYSGVSYMTSSMPQSSRKLKTRRDLSTPCPTPIHQGGTMPGISNVPNTYTSLTSETQCTVTLAMTPNSRNLKFGQFSEEIDKWIEELLESEKDFVQMVTQLNATDRMVFQNVSRLECLHNSLITLETSQEDVNSDLNRIGCELLMIEEAVWNIESRAEAKQACQANHATREHPSWASYYDDHLKNLYDSMLQMKLDLNYLTERLADVIHAGNSPRDARVGNGPVLSIGCILNYHYECLVDMEDTYVKCKTALENLQEQIKSQIISSRSINNC